MDPPPPGHVCDPRQQSLLSSDAICVQSAAMIKEKLSHFVLGIRVGFVGRDAASAVVKS